MLSTMAVPPKETLPWACSCAFSLRPWKLTALKKCIWGAIHLSFLSMEPLLFLFCFLQIDSVLFYPSMCFDCVYVCEPYTYSSSR